MTAPGHAIGICGTGRMGRGMAMQLLASGIEVHVWNRSPGPADALARQGAAKAASPAALAAACPVVIVSLTDEAALNAVYLGPDGLLAGDARKRLFIDTSTVAPATIRRIAGAAAERGQAVVDVPVVGSTFHAESGQLLGLAGGETQHVDRSLPVLDLVCRQVVRTGACGTGMGLKLVMNLMTGGMVNLLAEALALGDALGIALPLMLDTISEGPVACPLIKIKRPVLEGEASPVAFDIAGLLKDMRTIVAVSAEAGVMPQASGGAATMLGAAVAGGWFDRDMAELPRFVREAMTRVQGA